MRRHGLAPRGSGIMRGLSAAQHAPPLMSAETRAHLTDLVARALATVAPEAPADAVIFERPRDPAHGDYATTVALQLAKTLKAPPRKVAEQLLAALPASEWIERPEIAGPGF